VDIFLNFPRDRLYLYGDCTVVAIAKDRYINTITTFGNESSLFIVSRFNDEAANKQSPSRVSADRDSADFVPCRGIDPNRRAIFGDTAYSFEYVPAQQLGPNVCRAFLLLRSALRPLPLSMDPFRTPRYWHYPNI
jgi:hypothetical protein